MDGIGVPDATREVMDMLPLSETIDYGADMLAAPAAWKATNGRGVRIGILDTGADDHPDLEGALERLIPGEFDDNGHGTHVAGIIGARANGVGVRGIAPQSTLVIGKCVPGSWAGVSAALTTMIARRVDVINMSFGGSTPPPQAVLDALERAYALGIPVVASAGNSRIVGTNTIDYPARCLRCIPVAAIGADKASAPFSAMGDELVRGFAMPGVNVLSTYKDAGYARLSGTSMAAPFLTGLIALCLAKHRLVQGSSPIPIGGAERVQAVLEHLAEASVSLGDPTSFGHGYIDASLL